MRDSTRQLLQKLKTLPWYENIGKEISAVGIPTTPYVRCPSLEEAVKAAMSQSWYDVRMDDLQKIQKMMRSYSEDYFAKSALSYAFETSARAKEIHETIILPKFSSIELPERVRLYMLGDINGSLEEEENSWLGKTGFFTEGILFWHERGLWPCGWIGGAYPNGTMIVY